MADYRDLWRGLRCVLRHAPRGGYGFALLIPVSVERVWCNAVRVRIEASRKLVKVKPEALILPPTMRGVEVSAEYVGSVLTPAPARGEGE